MTLFFCFTVRTSFAFRTAFFFGWLKPYHDLGWKLSQGTADKLVCVTFLSSKKTTKINKHLKILKPKLWSSSDHQNDFSGNGHFTLGMPGSWERPGLSPRAIAMELATSDRLKTWRKVSWEEMYMENHGKPWKTMEKSKKWWKTMEPKSWKIEVSEWHIMVRNVYDYEPINFGVQFVKDLVRPEWQPVVKDPRYSKKYRTKGLSEPQKSPDFTGL